MPKYTGVSESQTQQAFFHWVAVMKNMDERYSLVFSIPNGGHRNSRVGATMKAEGAKAGVVDIFISVPSNGYHGAWIEVKREDRRNHKNGSLSDKQLQFLISVRQQGYFTAVCYTTDELIETVEKYMSGGVNIPRTADDAVGIRGHGALPY